MPLLLEIGAGENPAILQPGSVFQDNNLAYRAVDAWDANIELPFYADDATRARYLAALTITNGAELPFPDQSIDRVIMKNVFGEYTMHPRDTGSNIINTYMTLYEAFRVLRDGGEIAIAEENTPEPPASSPWRIGHTLLDAGFTDVTVFPCQSYKNERWLEERTKYWDISKNGRKTGGPGSFSRIAYFMRATRQTAPLEPFTQNIILPDVWRAGKIKPDDAIGRESWIREATFYRSAAPSTMQDSPQHHYRSVQPITVFALDEEINLEEYMEQVEVGDRTPIFSH